MKSLLGTLVLAAVVTGCATPPEANKQTKLTIAILTEYQQAEGDFAAEHARSTAYLASIAAQRRKALEVHDQVVKDEVALMKAVAEPGAIAVHERVTTLVATVSQKAAARHTDSQLQADTVALLKPLPNTTAATDETKKALGKLLDGVPKEVRYRELKGYYDMAKKSLEDAKATLDQPAPAASSPSP